VNQDDVHGVSIDRSRTSADSPIGWKGQHRHVEHSSTDQRSIAITCAAYDSLAAMR
jgi:hypothetical protein